jgi:hypothetical protein
MTPTRPNDGETMPSSDEAPAQPTLTREQIETLWSPSIRKGMEPTMTLKAPTTDEVRKERESVSDRLALHRQAVVAGQAAGENQAYMFAVRDITSRKSVKEMGPPGSGLDITTD